MRHWDEQRDHRSLVSAVRPCRGCEGPSRFSVQLSLKPQPPRLSMNAFNSAEVFPKRVGVPNMIPSAHSTSEWVGTPYSDNIRLLLSSQPGTLDITSGETRSGTRRSRASAPASLAPSPMALARVSTEPSRE